MSGILVAVIVAAGAVVLWFRHRFLGTGAGEESAGFDLTSFEAMRASGKISDEEFRRLRRLALGLPEEAEPAPPAEPADAAEPSDPPEKPGGSLSPDGEDDDA